jgi:hypothetical protein
VSEEKSIKVLIDQLISGYQLDGKMAEKKITTSWEEIVGKTISKYTKRITFFKRTMYLEIESASLKNDLYFHEQIIVDKVNQFCGSKVIDKIVFK